MNHDDLKRLQAYRGFPALSLRLPTHRRMPEALQDPTRLKNLIRRAEKALEEREVPSNLVSDYVDRLEAFHRQLDWRHLDQGLCVFVAPGRLAWVMLPEPVEEAVVVGETFLTRDLVRVANRTPRYRVLVLSEKATRWFEGFGLRLNEEKGHGFPMANEIAEGEPPEGFNRGVDPKDYANECTRVFLRRVAEQVRPRLATESAPMFVTGVDRLRSFYREVAEGQPIAGELEGSFDQHSSHDLAEAISSVVEAWQRDRRSEVLARFDGVKGTKHGVVGLQDAGKAAVMGRVETLLVESPYAELGRFNRSTGEVVLAANGGEHAAHEDVVDEIVETVMERGGEVIFYQDGRLGGAGAPIGAILRY